MSFSIAFDLYDSFWSEIGNYIDINKDNNCNDIDNKNTENICYNNCNSSNDDVYVFYLLEMID